jgi:hypothetical protein
MDSSIQRGILHLNSQYFNKIELVEGMAKQTNVQITYNYSSINSTAFFEVEQKYYNIKKRNIG